MQQMAAKGFAYVLLTLFFCAFIVCRFVEMPANSDSLAQTYGAERSLHYGLPFVGSSLTNGGLDPFTGKDDDARLRIVGAYIRSLIVAVSRAEGFRTECNTKLTRSQPIWLLNCAMLC